MINGCAQIPFKSPSFPHFWPQDLRVRSTNPTNTVANFLKKIL